MKICGHTYTDCVNTSGSVYGKNGIYYCKFSGGSCAANWTKVHTYYRARTCGDHCYEAVPCTTPASWDTPATPCPYLYVIDQFRCGSGTCNTSPQFVLCK